MANFQAQLDLSFDSEEEIDFPTVEAKLRMRTLHLKRQLKEVKNIQINRERLVEDVIFVYSDEAIIQHKLTVNFANELGEGYSGVSREFFPEFSG